jgi:hypothetical protein
MMPVPIAHPHLASPIAQMLTIAHGHHDHRRRRARVQKLKMPFGMRERGFADDRRYPRGVRRPGQAGGRLLGRRRTRFGLPVSEDTRICAVVIGLAVIAESTFGTTPDGTRVIRAPTRSVRPRQRAGRDCDHITQVRNSARQRRRGIKVPASRLENLKDEG